MSKFKNAFVAEVAKQQEMREQQEQLRNKHNITDNNTVIVEKSNFAKFTINILIRILKFCASIILILLAIIGLYSLLTPDIRNIIFKEINNIIRNMR